MNRNVLFTSLAYVLTFTPCFAANEYHFQILPPPVNNSGPPGINNHGAISGVYLLNGTPQGFYLPSLDGTLINVPAAGIPSEAGRSNDRGMVVGDYFTPDGHDHGFLYQPGHPPGFLTLDFPGSAGTSLVDINEPGDMIAGQYATADGVFHGTVFDFRGVPVGLGHWKSFDFPGATCTAAGGLNNQGIVVGLYTVPTGNPEETLCGPNLQAQAHGFIRTPDGSMKSLDIPGARETEAIDINNNGDIVGEFTDDQGRHGFVLDNHGNFTQIDFPNAILTVVLGINDSGEIVGFFRMLADAPNCSPLSLFCLDPNNPGPPVAHGFMARRSNR